MKSFIYLLLCILLSANAIAQDIAGGELSYVYEGRTPLNTYGYKFTLRLFRECSSSATGFAPQTIIGIYNNVSTSLDKTLVLHRSDSIQRIAFTPSTIPCLVNDVDVCYQIVEYSGTIGLPIAPFGYTAAWFDCCRSSGIANILDTTTGAAYFTRMPGGVHNVTHNTSARFAIKDTVVVCAGRPLSIDFSAFDADGDTLVYAFEEALTADALNNGGFTPNYYIGMVPYRPPFYGGRPMGSEIKIDPFTGLLSGTAPSTPGNYVVNVTVTEVKNGFAIASHNKDFLVKVKYCDIIEAVLKPEYATCDDFTFDFKNETPNPLIQSYYWDFGVPGGTSVSSTPSFTYTDTGTYKVNLVVTGNAGCIDSAVTDIHVFPLFKPGFSFNKACQDSIVHFTDTTFTTYGNITSYTWNFGDTATLADTSHDANPVYFYGHAAGPQTVSLKVTSSKGCEDSITQMVPIIENPATALAFHDTTICKTDTLQISMTGPGNYSWTPVYNILDPNTSTPLVYPDRPTTYYIATSFGDCYYYDSVKVNVLQFITVEAGRDTTICLTDSLQLSAFGEGRNYTWAPVAGLSNANIPNPVVSPLSSTTYSVEARLGHCVSKDSVTIQVAPYPRAYAGLDTTICYGGSVQLHASFYGNEYTWTNTRTLQDIQTLSPIANPEKSAAYILNVFGAPGCPKTVRDTVVVYVLPPLNVFAGNDTLVLEGQPLPLHATSSSATASYQWTPSLGLDNTQIANPVLLLNTPAGPLQYHVKVTTTEGCAGEDDITITAFKKGAEIFVPSAFSPNHDGKNDVIKAIPVGVRQFQSFQVFNRLGQRLFITTNPSQGWDGTANGVDQPAGAYVYSVSGIDIDGKPISKKGTFVLIR